MKVHPHTYFTFLVFVFFAFVIWEARDWPLQARLYPWVIGIPMLALAAFHIFTEFRDGNRDDDPAGAAPDDTVGATPADFQFTKGIDPVVARSRTINIFLWIFGFLAGLWLAGFAVTVPLFTFLYLKVWSSEGWILSLVLSGAAWLVYWGLFDRILHLPFPDGMIFTWLGL